VVDDDRVNLLLMRYALERMGHVVVTAESGTEGLEACGRESFDVVLLDLRMPDVDGDQVALTLRARERERRGVPAFVVCMSASEVEGDRERCAAAGADDYIRKPIEPTALAPFLERAAERRAPTPGPDATTPGAAEPPRGDSAPPPAEAPAPAAPNAWAPAPPDAWAPAALDALSELRASLESAWRHDDEVELGAALAGRHSGEPSPIDMAHLEMACMGIASLRREMLETLVAEIQAGLARFDEALRDRNLDDLRTEADLLHSLCTSVGANAFAELMAPLGNAGPDADLDALARMLPTLRHEWRRLQLCALELREAA
jgi:CheY-like chemotaxis protein